MIYLFWFSKIPFYHFIIFRSGLTSWNKFALVQNLNETLLKLLNYHDFGRNKYLNELKCFESRVRGFFPFKKVNQSQKTQMNSSEHLWTPVSVHWGFFPCWNWILILNYLMIPYFRLFISLQPFRTYWWSSSSLLVLLWKELGKELEYYLNPRWEFGHFE